MNKPKMLSLRNIRIDGGTQARVKCPEERIEQYVEDLGNGDVFPPVVVYFDGVDYWLADGFTRYFAHERMERQELLADIREGTRRDALKYACGANATHGEPRTNADKRKAVMLVLGDPEWGQLTEDEVAKICKVGRSLVNRMKRELAGKGDYPSRTVADSSTPDKPAEPATSQQATEDAPEESQPLESVADPTPVEAETVSEAAPLDGVGIPITCPVIQERFAAVCRASEARAALVRAAQVVNEICQGPGGEHLAMDVGAKLKGDVVAYKDHHIAQAMRRLRFQMPHCSVCPYCHHNGSLSVKSCKACRGYGYVTLQQWDQCPEHLRQAVLADFGAQEPPEQEDDE